MLPTTIEELPYYFSLVKNIAHAKMNMLKIQFFFRLDNQPFFRIFS